MALAASYMRRVATAAAALLVAVASATHAGHILPQGERVEPHRHATFGRQQVGFMSRHSERELRVCNAYPNAVPLDVFAGRRLKLTAAGPMPYKSCRDFTTRLHVGQKIVFRLGDNQAGIFVMQALPQDEDATLLLVIRRHDTVSSAVSFESHVFAADSPNPQVAVIDTYRGSAKSVASIVDERPVAKSKLVKSQLLRYNSLVSVSEGLYGVNLTSATGITLGTASMVSLHGESYVILRTGVDAQEGDSYDQDLVVYPHSDITKLPKFEGGKKPDPNGAFARNPWFYALFTALLSAFAVGAL